MIGTTLSHYEIEAYESAMERFEQTGATFKYVALTRERLAALCVKELFN